MLVNRSIDSDIKTNKTKGELQNFMFAMLRTCKKIRGDVYTNENQANQFFGTVDACACKRNSGINRRSLRI